MSKIKNDWSKYLSRSDLITRRLKETAVDSARRSKRKSTFRNATISANFYIDLRDRPKKKKDG